jgi:uncharacterized membrane protein
MNDLARLLEHQPLVFVHLCAALAALVLGAAILLRAKGTPGHRALGWTWVLLMATATVSSAFIRGYRMPNVWGFTPIHLLTLLAAVMLPLGIWFIRRGRVQAHRKVMRGLYFGGCVVAGFFTLAPSRFLGQLLWKHVSLVLA